MNILMVMDISFDPPFDHDYSEYFALADWEADRDILNTLKKLGHTVKLFGVNDNIEGLIQELRNNPPDLVFNLCEAYRQERDLEPHLVALYELLGIPYTGCSHFALQVCKDKALTKKILAYHDISVPGFEVSFRSKPLRSFGSLRFPLIIKPLDFEASEGISQNSVVWNEQDGLTRLEFIHERLKAEAIAEEYIEGREIYVGVLGNKRCEVLPPREVFFDKVPEGELKFASYRAKWDDAYRKKWGIDSGPAEKISKEVEHEIKRASRLIHELFQLEGYGRIDFRITSDDKIYFIEANPNPSIAQDEDFALCAAAAGHPYPELIEKIIHLGMKRKS
jgi:D-alanine-D-alanine ligase